MTFLSADCADFRRFFRLAGCKESQSRQSAIERLRPLTLALSRFDKLTAGHEGRGNIGRVADRFGARFGIASARSLWQILTASDSVGGSVICENLCNLRMTFFYPQIAQISADFLI